MSVDFFDGAIREPIAGVERPTQQASKLSLASLLMLPVSAAHTKAEGGPEHVFNMDAGLLVHTCRLAGTCMLSLQLWEFHPMVDVCQGGVQLVATSDGAARENVYY